MLTPTDVHYLVGLLTLISQPDNVEVELGSMIYDVAAEEERDIDITVKIKDNDGNISAFKGIEVKDHTRPLDVTHVEQLCRKYSDMPDITYKAIVSASGYTEPAVKKANYHGVDLFHLIPWTDPSNGFDHVFFPEEFQVKEKGYRWVSNVDIIFNPHQQALEELFQKLQGNPRVYNEAGNDIPECPDINALANSLLKSVIRDAKKQGISIDVQIGEVKQVKLHVDLSYKPYVLIDGDKYVLEQALISGVVTSFEESIKPEFKILLRYGETSPYTGCTVFEMSQGSLAGLSVYQSDRTLRFFNIPLRYRLRKKIYRHRLR